MEQLESIIDKLNSVEKAIKGTGDRKIKGKSGLTLKEVQSKRGGTTKRWVRSSEQPETVKELKKPDLKVISNKMPKIQQLSTAPKPKLSISPKKDVQQKVEQEKVQEKQKQDKLHAEKIARVEHALTNTKIDSIPIKYYNKPQIDMNAKEPVVNNAPKEEVVKEEHKGILRNAMDFIDNVVSNIFVKNDKQSNEINDLTNQISGYIDSQMNKLSGTNEVENFENKQGIEKQTDFGVVKQFPNYKKIDVSKVLKPIESERNQELEDASSKLDSIKEVMGYLKLGGKVDEISADTFRPQVITFTVSKKLLEKVSDYKKLQQYLPNVEVGLINGTDDKIGISINRSQKEVVPFNNIVNGDDFKNSDAKMPVVIGKDMNGNNITKDMKEMVHLMVGGSTGSGKSEFLKNIVNSVISSKTPEEAQVEIMTNKPSDWDFYKGSPHVGSIISNNMEKVKKLNSLVKEMDDRSALLTKLGGNLDIDSYNEMANAYKNDPKYNDIISPMPRKTIIIDEFSDIKSTMNKQDFDKFTSDIQRVAQIARFVGIHLVLATQRPTADTIPNSIRDNLPTKVAFKTSSNGSSHILGNDSASRLTGKGDMIMYDESGQNRYQGAYLNKGNTIDLANASRQAING